MRVGLFIPPQSDLRSVVPMAVRAEAQGFDFLACGEHVFFHGPVSNAFVTLAAAAGATQRIRLMTALTILPVYPPALAAKLISTLDGVSGGRVEIGIGVGGEHPPEFEAVGVPVRERGARTDEALTILTDLFAGGPVHYDGRFTRLAGQSLEPLPVQRPRPPFWVGGRGEASMRRAGRHGDGWMPYLVTPDQVAEGLAGARDVAVEAGRQAHDIAGGVLCWSNVDDDGAKARRTAAEIVGNIYQQDFSKSRYLLTGTPDEVASRMREFADAGAETIVFSPACEGSDLEGVIDTFASRVLPQLPLASGSVR
jgi:probable F420-dependent oxidoreductase